MYHAKENNDENHHQSEAEKTHQVKEDASIGVELVDQEASHIKFEVKQDEEVSSSLPRPPSVPQATHDFILTQFSSARICDFCKKKVIVYKRM